MIFCKRCGNYAADGLDNCPKCSASLFDAGEPTLVGSTIESAPSFAASTSGAEPAGHLQRLVAWLIDSLLQGLILGIGFAGFLFLEGMLGSLILLGVCLVVVAYEPFFIASKGTTPGKSGMGLRVVDKDGSRPGPGRSVIRFLIKVIFNGIFWIVGLFTARRQCIHDLITTTYVVQE